MMRMPAVGCLMCSSPGICAPPPGLVALVAMNLHTSATASCEATSSREATASCEAAGSLPRRAGP
eukprot:6214462-Pleurochrysis_carterae.AAC.1